jgi:GGDEF domain-containing protein
LEAPLQIFLYYGDQEIAQFASGTNPKDIQRAAETRAPMPMTQATVDEDKITGLPWSASLRGDAARLAAAADLHVIAVHLGGLETLMDVYGYKAAHSVLRQIARRLKRVMDEKDRLTRHSGDKLLIFTTRTLEEIRNLVEVIHQQVAAVGLETDGDRLPRSRLGVATVDRLAETDPLAVQALIDAVIISAEIASTGGEAPAGPIQMEQPMAQAAVPAAPQWRQEVVPEPQEVNPEPPVVSAPPPPPPEAVPEPVPVQSHEAQYAGTQAEEEPEPPVYELPAEQTAEEVAMSTPLAAATPEPDAPAPTAAAEPAAMPVPTPDGDGRIRFKGASLDVSGQVATATVKLMLGDREVVGRAVGRNAQERRLFLAAEAAARAVTEFLPPGYGVVIHDIQPAPPDVGKALWAAVLFLTPNAEESLLGIAPIDDMVFEAAGKAVLNAVNRRVGLLLGTIT